MKLFFQSRAKARTFATNTGRKTDDNGTAAPAGRRWAVDVTPTGKKTAQPVAA